MDGLVSTGNEFPCTILEINFFNQKKFPNYFINILKLPVDKPEQLQVYIFIITICIDAMMFNRINRTIGDIY